MAGIQGIPSNVVTTGNPYSVVLRLAMPTVVAMLSQSVVNEVDIVFFSRLPASEGSTAQAALFPCLIILWLFGGSLSAISVGTQVISARRFAENNLGKSGAVLLNSWLFSTASSVLFTAVAYLVMPSLLSVAIKMPEVREAAASYLDYRLLGITSMVVTFSFKAFFDGVGKTHVHLISAIVMNLINVVLCYFFIFGNAGAPKMGISGAGLAALLSTWVGLFIMVGWALRPKYKRLYHPFSFAKFDRQLVMDILRLSVPSAIATIAVMSGFFLFSVIVSHLDSIEAARTASGAMVQAEAVNSAATTVIVGILKLTFTACLAFGTSTATLVSQSLGEGDGDKASRFGWVSVRLGLGIFGVVGFLEGVVFPQEILAFVSSSEAVREAALMPMRMMGILTPMIAVGMILTQALFGAGNSVFVMIVELVLHFTCLVPLAYLLGISLGFGLVGIWGAAVVYVVLLTAVMSLKFAGGSWKHIKI